MKKEIFVYAVCGGSEHIAALNLSLRYLKRITVKDIIVVTDAVRNKGEILHENIIDYTVPNRLGNKEAAIFLKTRLNDILPEGNTYCYLDSDVIAVNKMAEEIFRYFIPPVIFAPDHCPIDEFSPGCVKCGCVEVGRKEHERFKQLAGQYKQVEKVYFEKYVPKDPEKYKQYIHLMETMKDYERQTPLSKKYPVLKNILPLIKPYPYSFGIWLKRNGGYLWDRNSRKIYDEDNTLLYDDSEPQPNFRTFIEKHSNFNLDECRKFLMDGKEYYYFYSTRCSHLLEAIKNKFNILVTDNKWNHWNGGVFVFDDSAKDFFETWHHYTMEIFNDSYWEKRDQGTLIAAAWKTGMQNHSRLPEIFNFIADYDNEFLKFDEIRGFSRDNFTTAIHPAFVHIYHHFGDKSWPVWQWVEKLL